MFGVVLFSVFFTIITVGNSQFLPKPTFDGRIVGGEQIDITQVPYQISLQSSFSHICGGSIIGDRWILTAAHCTYGSTAKRFKVRVGSSQHAEGGKLHQVKRIVQHEKFNYSNIDFDFSLLELEEPIKQNERETAIKLPEQDAEIEDGDMCLVSGWGNTQDSSENRNFLRAAKVPVVNQNECSKAYSAYGGITPRMICAGLEKGGKDACQGDSGGPLVSGSVLVGVVSWGYGCAKPHFPGVYSRVAAVRDWIRETSEI